MKNIPVKRYRATPKVREKTPPAGFVIRSIRQAVACVLLFLICLPLSASDNPVRPYIARVLVASSDIKAVKLGIGELWEEVRKRISDYPQTEAPTEMVSDADAPPDETGTGVSY